MGGKMLQMTEEKEQKRQDKYNKLVFATEYPEKERIEAALKHAHEIRQFEIRLYWQRSLFFWGFIIAFLTAFALLLNSLNDESARNSDSVIIIAIILLSSIGFFTSFAWKYMETGSKTWQQNWEKHIDFLENTITGKLHKVNIGKPLEFFSVSRIHRTFISSMVLFWCFLFLLSIYSAVVFCVIDMMIAIVFCTIFFIISIFLEQMWVGTYGEWRTGFGGESITGDKLTLRHRESPEVDFVEKPYPNR